uniref:Uncharacterized protein n=1 Tax=Scleropages formosus TaxID=113540 RepID=A0A8C9T9L2_SCLFO
MKCPEGGGVLAKMSACRFWKIQDMAALLSLCSPSHQMKEYRIFEHKKNINELHKKTAQADIAMAPLKAKLAYVAQKCRERNRLIVRMARVLESCGCGDSALMQEAEDMVNDASLLEYSSTFLPGQDNTLGWNLDSVGRSLSAFRLFPARVALLLNVNGIFAVASFVPQTLWPAPKRVSRTWTRHSATGCVHPRRTAAPLLRRPRLDCPQ